MKFLFDHDVPDDLAYALQASGHEVRLLRAVLPVTTPDEDILRFAGEHEEVLVTCNRDDFLAAASRIPHVGLLVLIRRRSRAQERAALIRLLALRGVGFHAGPGGSLLLAFIRSGLEPVFGFEPRTDGSQSRQSQPPESSISVLVRLPLFVASRQHAEA